MAGTKIVLWRRVYRSLRLLCCVVVLLAAAGAAMASEYHGIVSFNGLPVPGVTVTVGAIPELASMGFLALV